LSASFIPVYAGGLTRDPRAASQLAGAIAALLSLVTAVLVLAGVLAAPLLVAVIAPGFSGEKRELTVALVRILFPGAGLLVLSAWCLGILNSHHRFLLSYMAPVVWNAAMIATLVTFGAGRDLPVLAVYLAWGSVAGSALQFLVQLPAALRLVPGLRLRLRTASADVHTVIRNFGPVALGRGVVQISAYVDAMIGSLLGRGAVAALANAQLLYTLPVSLFGMSVSAAQLPGMSQDAAAQDATQGGARDPTAMETRNAALRGRLDAGLRQIAFFVIPSSIAFVALGDVIAAGLLQTGRFTRADAIYVWGIVAGSTVGLLASTMARLHASACYALRDTRTPLRFAVVRVSIGIVLGYAGATMLPPALDIEARWGAAILTAASGVAAWVEFLLLRSRVESTVGRSRAGGALLSRLWPAAMLSAAAAFGLKLSLSAQHPIVVAALVLGLYGLLYLSMTLAFGVPEASAFANRVRRYYRRGISTQ